MGKRKKSDYQKTKISIGTDRHFFRIYETLLYSERFLKMTPSAQKLYFYMGLASNGKTEFKFPHSAYIRIMDKKTFIRSKQALIDNGFIEEIHHCATSANVYKLSHLWQSSTIPKQEPRFYPRE